MLSAPRSLALQLVGQVIPQPVVARLVVDTGASLTAIDCAIIQQLNLTSTGSTLIHTPSTQGQPHAANQYDVGLTIYGATMNDIVYTTAALPVIDGNFRAQGIDGLLGRDVLATGRLFYLGDANTYGISF